MPLLADSPAPVQAVARVAKALSDETRVRIVALLAHGELCVCHLEQVLGLSQSLASRHLGVLRAAGIVRARRAGSWVHYALVRQDDATAAAMLAAVVKGFAGRSVLKAAVKRALASSGPAACR